MGQKTSAKANRLKITTTWDSNWIAAKKNYKEWLLSDLRIRECLDKLKGYGIAKVEIERAEKMINVKIYTAKPGIVIGKKGSGIEAIKKDLQKMVASPINLTVQEVKQPDLSAKLVGDNIVEQIEKRIPFKRAMKKAIGATMRAGAEGIKILCSGRLAGAEIARSERTFDGRVPLHTLRADIDFAKCEAYTTYGRIGVQVWICKGEVLPKKTRQKTQEGGQS
ncbi:MAG: 30S ribosomal protein S3 [Armatimonadota bacterium]